MNRDSDPLIALIVAIACFFAGYIVGSIIAIVWPDYGQFVYAFGFAGIVNR